MIELFKQFFSFKKLMKDRLVASFFYLGLVVIAVTFLSTILGSFKLMGHSFFGGLAMFFGAFFSILFLFIGLRLACEMMVTLFRINDNLSPDGGKSDTADIDVFETAKDAATKAAQSATTATKSVVEITKTKINERKDDRPDIEDDYPDYEDVSPPKPVVKKRAPKRKPAKAGATRKVYTKITTPKKATPKKTSVKKSVKKVTPKKSQAKKSTTKKPTPKK
ncbi:MAG: DUF4282 domain-containing protein [Robiginitomaculum sp.]|nr:DUF4282 domain-containing protein [Robiginitomaculum sp.]